MAGISTRIGTGPRVGDAVAWTPGVLAPEFWVDATLSAVSGGKLLNIGTGGTALDAQFGSTTGVDTNDPTLLVHSGTNYLYLPGVAGNNANTPNAAPLQITSDIEIVVRAALDDWTPAAQTKLVAKSTTVGQRAYALSLNTAGRLELALYADGTTGTFPLSSIAVPAVDGTPYWIKATWSDTGDVANFYYAADQATEPTSWTQLGSANVAAVSAGIFAGTSVLEFGSLGNSAEMMAGKFYRAILRNGIGGTTVFDADFTRGITSGGQTTFTESSSNAATVPVPSEM